MVKVLKEYVIPHLLDNGFYGQFPHYKKIYTDRIELLGFPTNNHGNSFSVVVSTIFPDEASKILKNYYTEEFQSVDEMNVFSTCKRFGLKGIFEGEFYYTDVYCSKLRLYLSREYDFYNAVSEKRAATYVPQSGEVLVQKANDELYIKIADAVNRQMPTAYDWWQQYNTPQKMQYAK